MPDFLDIILLGIIEGITEFLPISSTGHLLIAEHWLGAQSDTFNIVIQAGSILAVTLVYWRRIWQLLTNWKDPDNRDYLFKLITAFVITSVIGLVAVKMGWMLPDTLAPIAWALVIGGIWMIVAERLAERRPESTKITWKVAILVGIAQMVAGIFPGTSRSAATIFMALLAGTGNRSAATEFAFLVGIPTMYAASGYKLLEQIHQGVDIQWATLALGFVSALITSFIVIKWLLRFIRTHRFTVFAIYRIIFGGLLLALGFLGVLG